MIARHDRDDVKGRDGRVLRRQHQPRAQVAGQAEGGQEADAAAQAHGDPADGVPCIVEDGGLSF